MTTVTSAYFADQSDANDYFALLKPRVMSLVVFIGLAGMMAAPVSLHPVLAFTTILCIAIGAGAAGCINMWYERDVDALMSRTRNRPIPSGRIAPESALAFGVTLAAASVLLQGLAVNILSAVILAISILFYVFVYTIWLKRRTPQNIVIGGAAGAFPPLIGWAAATGTIDAAPLSMFLLVFLWTPPHFWALALYKSGDYARAGIPMLPVVRGRQSTLNHILAYSLTLIPASLLPWYFGAAGLFYAATAGALSVLFVILAAQLWRSEKDIVEKRAKQLFGYSILYLFLVFAILMADAVR
ncbi:MAG: protoheme IX farnesyltransferase [Alphaproteobacteria bacterium]|nr:MAG: protoheme IX farnesyltransferase [Alphaproteobacteria bacterium]